MYHEDAKKNLLSARNPFISKKAKHKKKSLLGFSEVMTENEST